jgi:hypothetical protein
MGARDVGHGACGVHRTRQPDEHTRALIEAGRILGKLLQGIRRHRRGVHRVVPPSKQQSHQGASMPAKTSRVLAASAVAFVCTLASGIGVAGAQTTTTTAPATTTTLLPAVPLPTTTSSTTSTTAPAGSTTTTTKATTTTTSSLPATTTTSTAAPATSCNTGTWPDSAEGQTVSFRAGAASGAYLWHDGKGWHLRVTHPGRKKVVFAGSVVSDRQISEHKVKDERNDRVVRSRDRKSFTFQFRNYGRIDGIDFHSPCAGSLTITLKRAGAPLPPTAIYTGSKGAHPDANPVILTRAATRPGPAGTKDRE